MRLDCPSSCSNWMNQKFAPLAGTYQSQTTGLHSWSSSMRTRNSRSQDYPKPSVVLNLAWTTVPGPCEAGKSCCDVQKHHKAESCRRTQIATSFVDGGRRPLKASCKARSWFLLAKHSFGRVASYQGQAGARRQHQLQSIQAPSSRMASHRRKSSP